MSPSEIIEVVAGIGIVLAIVYDIFSSVIVPRRVSRLFRLSAFTNYWSWWVWRAIGLRMADEDRRENWLASFGPAAIVGLLFVWLVAVNAGYALIFYGLRDHIHPMLTSYHEAAYFAGTSLLTVGYGDFVPMDIPARYTALAAASTGLSMFALIISFLFSTFASFQQREIFVVMMGGRAGAPASGVTLLETAAKSSTFDDLAQSFRDGERWAALVLESHLAYPILIYFRSSHDDESWVGTIGAMLDAATLLLITEDHPLHGRAKLFHILGVHLVRDLGRYYQLPQDEGTGIERHEFTQACEQLNNVGIRLQSDDTAWQRFSEQRAQYAGPLNALARYMVIPPARWIGDRSQIRRH
jgi:hypothetical protein